MSVCEVAVQEYMDHPELQVFPTEQRTVVIKMALIMNEHYESYEDFTADFTHYCKRRKSKQVALEDFVEYVERKKITPIRPRQR